MSDTTAITNIYTKIQAAKKQLSEKNLKKTGNNSYLKFDYYELSDFMPSVIQIFAELGLFSKITFTDEIATLKIVNAENPSEYEEYTSPMRIAAGDGKTNAMQALGGVQTYQRRYLYVSALDITENDIFDAESGSQPVEEKKQSKSNADYIKESREREKDYALSTGENPNRIISEAQRRRMFAIADGNETLLKEILGKHGYEHSKAVKTADYEAICAEVETAAKTISA